MRGFIEFNRGLLGMAWPWRLWIGLLVALNFVGPLFFLDRLEAHWTLAAMAAAAFSMMVLTQLQGFTRLLGLGHVWWIPLVWYLVASGAWSTPGIAQGWFGVWRDAVVLVNAISLLIDTGDVARYIAGDRAPMKPTSV